MSPRPTKADEKRTDLIIDAITDAFAPLMKADPHAFRVKYRKMAADPFAFYRGTACLFYADVAHERGQHRTWDADYVSDRSSRIWIHGDLHAENFGTYMNASGRLVFDVNDFDEAYIGHYTWDLQRFAASLALMGWTKALPEDDVRRLIARYARGYLAQVSRYVETEDDDGDFALNLDTAEGPILQILNQARKASRIALLDGMTAVKDGVRTFTDDGTTRRLSKTERKKLEAAFIRYLDSIPSDKRYDRRLFYDLRDLVGKSGFGIGSAGLPAYNVLVEGFNQALENDVVLSMKQANVPAVSRFVDTSTVEGYFENEAHRTVVSQRALQAHTDPLLGWTTVDGVAYVVAEVSPYESDLEWGELTEPDEIGPVVEQLGRATAKIHCASDDDSDQDLVDFSVEEEIAASLEGRRKAFTEALVEFGLEYAVRVRRDHALFVEAFRSGRIGVDAT
jgi:uncharacterized protein (DUF2252 family)